MATHITSTAKAVRLGTTTGPIRLPTCGTNPRQRRALTFVSRAQQQQPGCVGAQPNRRALLWSATAAFPLVNTFLFANDASASSLLEFWRSRQRQNGGAKILAPIRVARMKLQGAQQALGDSPTAADYEGALEVVRRASLNCYIYDSPDTDSLEAKASLLQQKYAGGIEVCTFRILLKNVVLYVDNQSLVDEATEACDNLTRLFSMLDSQLTGASQMEDVPPDAITAAIQETIDATTAFEVSLQRCLGVEEP